MSVVHYTKDPENKTTKYKKIIYHRQTIKMVMLSFVRDCVKEVLMQL